MATRDQLSKIRELTELGWKVITQPPFRPGAPVEVESPDGERFTVDASGNLTPSKTLS